MIDYYLLITYYYLGEQAYPFSIINYQLSSIQYQAMPTARPNGFSRAGLVSAGPPHPVSSHA